MKIGNVKGNAKGKSRRGIQQLKTMRSTASKSYPTPDSQQKVLGPRDFVHADCAASARSPGVGLRVSLTRQLCGCSLKRPVPKHKASAFCAPCRSTKQAQQSFTTSVRNCCARKLPTYLPLLTKRVRHPKMPSRVSEDKSQRRCLSVDFRPDNRVCLLRPARTHSASMRWAVTPARVCLPSRCTVHHRAVSNEGFATK